MKDTKQIPSKIPLIIGKLRERLSKIPITALTENIPKKARKE
ncbi:hypothetical protein [Coprococcus eutactus]